MSRLLFQQLKRQRPSFRTIPLPTLYPSSLLSTATKAPDLDSPEGSWKEADPIPVPSKSTFNALEDNTESLPRLLLKERDSKFPDVSLVMLLIDDLKKKDQGAFDHVEIATAVHSLAFIIRRPGFSIHDRSQMQRAALRLTEGLCHQLPGVTDRVLANVVYGLGILFKGITVALHSRLERCLKTLSEEIIREHHLVAFSQQGLSNIMYACGCLNWKPQWMLIQLGREIVHRIVGFKSQEIANIISSISKLGFHNPELIMTLGIEAAGPHRVATFSNQEFCNLLYGLVIMQPHLEDLSLRPVFGRLMFEAGSDLRLKRYNRQDLATIVYCIAALDRGTIVTSYTPTLLPKLLSKFGEMLRVGEALDRQLSMVLYSCAKVGVKEPSFIFTVNRCLVKRSNELNNLWSITLILWALTVLDVLTPEAFLSMCRRICDLRREGYELNDSNWVQLTQATQYVRHLPDAVELDPIIKDLIEEAMGISKNTAAPFRLTLDDDQLPGSFPVDRQKRYGNTRFNANVSDNINARDF